MMKAVKADVNYISLAASAVSQGVFLNQPQSQHQKRIPESKRYWGHRGTF